MIAKLGTDGLRLWASSIDFSSEAVVSETLLRNVSEVFRKVRNTCRFLLSNLYDFDIKKDAIDFEKMRPVDQYVLKELFEFNYSIINAYNNYDFTEVFHRFGDYCSVNLSTFYFEIIKDTLYVEKADSHARRSVQTACWYILDSMTKLMAPIFSFTAEQVSDLYQKDKTESIHMQEFNDLKNITKFLVKSDRISKDFQKTGSPISLLETLDKIESIVQEGEYILQWNVLKLIRSAILKATESLRETNEIKRSLDARATMYIDSESEMGQYLAPFLKQFDQEELNQFFKEFAIVSQFELVQSQKGLAQSSVPGVYLKVEKARGEKCPRCWQWTETDHKDHLCLRCEKAIS